MLATVRVLLGCGAVLGFALLCLVRSEHRQNRRERRQMQEFWARRSAEQRRGSDTKPR